MINVKRSGLARAMDALKDIVPSRPLAPTSSAISIEYLDSGHLRFVASGNEVWGHIDIEVIQGKEFGPLMVNAAKLASVVSRGLHDDTVKIYTNKANSRLIFESDTDHRQELAIEAMETHQLPEVSGEYAASMESKVLGDALGRTINCVATDEGKYAMQGVLLRLFNEGGQGQVLAYGTNGKILAKYYGGTCTTSSDVEGLIPLAVAKLIQKINRRGHEGVIKINLGSNTVVVDFGDATIGAKLLEGRFPPAEDILPKKFATTAVVVPSKMIESLALAKISTTDESTACTIEFAEEKIRLSCAQAERASYSATHHAQPLRGDAVTLKLDPDYFTSILEPVKGDGEVTIQLNGERKPVVVHADGYTALIVPMV